MIDLERMGANMNGLSIEELIVKAAKENVRIEVEITPDSYGSVIQRITIEPYVPYEPKCPYGVPTVTVVKKPEE